MSDSHNQSYYEIALTSRQVAGAFLILLVCLVAAFFSGVWIGRGALPAGAQMAESPTDLSAEAGSDLPRFDFFGGAEGEEEPAAQEPAGEAETPPPARRAETPPALADPDPSTTLVEDLGVEEPGRAEPRALPETRLRPSTPPVGTAGDLVIQVFSSADEDQARALVERLAGGGYPAFVSPDEINGRLMYRVRIGPYPSQSEAEAVANRVRQAYRVDTWITR